MKNLTKMRIAFYVAIFGSFALGWAFAFHLVSLISVTVGIVLLSVVAHSSAAQDEAYKNAREDES